MSSYSAEAAEQVVRMSLEGAEVAVRLAGSGAKHLAILLYSILKDQKKTRGKIRLTNMLRSGKELKVFAVMDNELRTFCEEAKKYGVLYTVLKDRDSSDGLTDVMVRAEDASKVNRIFDRFHLTTVDMGSVKAQIEQARSEKAQKEEQEVPEDDLPEKPKTEKEKLDEFMDKLLSEEEPSDPNREEGKETKSLPSEPSSERKQPTGKDRDSRTVSEKRPSVKKELEEIRKDLNKDRAVPTGERHRPLEHKAPKKKRKKVKSK